LEKLNNLKLRKGIKMGRIAFRPKTELFNNLMDVSHTFNEVNDCSVKAVAVVLGVDYATAHDICKKAGRVEQKGMACYQIEKALENEGKKLTVVSPAEFIKQYPGKHVNLKSVTTHHPDRFREIWADGKIYLIFTNNHVAAIVDGVNHDWSRGKAHRVIRIVEVSNTDE
jgi:hypothetical protein